MKVAVLQSNYLPWKGYFDLIDRVDLFVFYDDVQYTKNDWRNRNRIKTVKGSEWLTVPVGKVKGRLIDEVVLDDGRWQEKHWKTLLMNYSKSRYFSEYREFFEDFYLKRNWDYLSIMNQYFITHVARNFLSITTKFDSSRNYPLSGKKDERLRDLLLQVGCTEYVSGPGAQAYLADDAFIDDGISISWMDYSGYPEYQQSGDEFDHFVSIIDVLFNVGPESSKYIKPNVRMHEEVPNKT